MSVSFSTGQKFKFPNDDNIYTFVSIDFTTGKPVVFYQDSSGEGLNYRTGYYLSDLKHIS